MARHKAGTGEEYQQKTKYTRETIGSTDSGFVEQAEQFKQYPGARQVIPLSPSPPARGGSDFWQTVARRRSERTFTGDELSRDELEMLVFATQGVTAKHAGYLLRTAPSAGALYPVETYLMVNRVVSLAAGIYHLNVAVNCLELLRTGDFSEQLASAALGQQLVASGCVTFIWTAIPGRGAWKYGDRVYRYLYLDAGHIGQNLYLAAVNLRLGCCTIGAFYDDEVNGIVGADGTMETAVYMGVVGRV